MIWEGYEFDEGFRPDGFEDWAYDQVNVGYAFYLRDKYVTDDTGLYEDKDSGTIHIFCPHTRETFEAGKKEVFGEKKRKKGAKTVASGWFRRSIIARGKSIAGIAADC